MNDAELQAAATEFIVWMRKAAARSDVRPESIEARLGMPGEMRKLIETLQRRELGKTGNNPEAAWLALDELDAGANRQNRWLSAVGRMYYRDKGRAMHSSN